MAKKVHEVAKELDVSSKDMISEAKKLGINAKTRMSVLLEEDIEKIKKAFDEYDKDGNSKSSVPIGKPIVDEEYLANKGRPQAKKDDIKKDISEKATEKAIEEDGSLKKSAKESEEAGKMGNKIDNKSDKKSDKKVNKAKQEVVENKKTSEKKTVKKNAEKNEPKADNKDKSGIKIADSETISQPKIKIIKRGEDIAKENKAKLEKKKEKEKLEKKKRAEKKAASQKNDKRRRSSNNDKQSSGDDKKSSGNERRSSRRSSDSRDNIPQEPQTRSNSRKKKKNNKEEYNKFAKLERRSLEKKERKKYVKPKQEVEEVVEEVLPKGTFKLDVPITVAGFSEQTEISTSQVIMTLMKMGIMANINQTLDEDVVQFLAGELGINVVLGEIEKEEVEEGIENFVDNEKDLKSRPPVITVMGHVDHGKTSLLDAIRSTHETSKEFGGITQHIGASEVSVNGRKIVCLDTPGHEAFTAMRARGAQITDIAILVVAADDSVKPQTKESISHAKAAGVPVIVAINKIDKPGANIDKVKKDLADNEILVEDWGGEIISVPVSAKTGEGITELLEMILLQADMMELKANPDRKGLGTVIEARLDKGRGPVATLLVNNGTVRAGESLVAGTSSGRIRAMTDFRGKKIAKAGPATAVEILGLTEVPQAGDSFNIVRDDKTARAIAESRQEKLREEIMAKNSSMSLEKLFSQIQEGEAKELNLIIKADVQGSVGAIIASLEKLNTEDVVVKVVHSGVGTVNESDVMLAQTSNAVIIGFNIRPSSAVTTLADNAGVEIRLYTVIYDALNDVEAAMKGMLDPDFKEELLGKAVVRETFKVPGIGIIAGTYITEGKMARNAQIRLVRDGILIHEGKISSLKRFKDDAKEVAQGYECGLGIEDYNDLKEEDVIECFRMVEVKND